MALGVINGLYLNGVDESTVANTYSPSLTYKQGDIRVYGMTLYRAKQDIDTPEEFDPQHWSATTCSEEIKRNNSTKTEMLTSTLVAGTTELVITNSALTANSIIDLYVDESHYTLSPSDVVLEDGKVTLTFDEAQDEDVSVGVKLLFTNEITTDELERLDGLEDDITAIKTDHDFTISTTWEDNTDLGDYETYPFKQSITTTLYTDDSKNDSLVFGADPTDFMSADERAEMSKLCDEVKFTSSAIIILASEETTCELTLRVKGV